MDYDTEYKENLAAYENLELNNVFVNEILSLSELEMIDKLLLSFISEKQRKTAFVVGNALVSLQKNNQLHLFKGLTENIDLLLAQRINNLVVDGKIKSYGNVKAIRFSEIAI